MLTCQNLVYSQNATVEWDFSTPSTIAGFDTDDNWALGVIQTSDGNYVSCGFADKFTGNKTITCGSRSITSTQNRRHPSVLKFSPTNGAKVIWESIPTQNDVFDDSFSGGYNDIVEFTKDGHQYLFAIGNLTRDTSKDKKPLITIFDAETGEIALNDSGDPCYLELFDNIDGLNGRLTNLQPVYDSNGALISVYVCGQVKYPGGLFQAAIYCFKADFNDFGLDVNFNGVGFKQYGETDHISYLTDIIRSKDGNFVTTGWNAEESGLPGGKRNVYAFAIDIDGNVQWETSFGESTLEALNVYEDDTDSANTCNNLVQENDNEEGFSIRQFDDESYALLSRFDFINETDCSKIGGCDPFQFEQYYNCDMALIHFYINNGDVNFLPSIDAGHATAIDFWNQMVQKNTNTLFLLGADQESNSDRILGSVIKVEYNGTDFIKKWRKDFCTSAKSGTQSAEYFCPFGITGTADGGLVICGNNELHGDDYEFIKLNLDADENDCFNATQGPADISGNVVWNSAKSVKGTITIKSGGKLTIDNTIITFANTYTTNDIYDRINFRINSISAANFVPTKIVIEPNGWLVLNNCVLKGADCGQVGGMWEGIIVVGNNQAYPTPSAQGKMQMFGNSVIRDAYYGISVCERDYDGNGRSYAKLSGGGGILEIGSSIYPQYRPSFVNCRSSIFFAPYTYVPYYYANKIQNADFSCDDVLKDPLYATLSGTRLGSKHFIEANTVNITVENCTFGGLDNLDWEDRTKAIEGYNARLRIFLSEFDRLGYGVLYNNPINNSKGVVLAGNTFTGIPHSAVLNAANFSTISGNHFYEIPEGAGISLLNSSQAMRIGSYALLLANSPGTTIDQNNEFVGVYSPTTPNTAYGIIMHNSDNIASETRENQFTNINFGVQTQQKNGGYQLHCNTFTNNGYAMNINPQSPSGVFSDQG
ncbi:MAG: hypothetical protein ACOYOA_16130, partial [Saprospiraceae bacterium]